MAEAADVSPGLLTVLRERLVSNSRLATLCARCGLSDHARIGSRALRHHVRAFCRLRGRGGTDQDCTDGSAAVPGGKGSGSAAAATAATAGTAATQVVSEAVAMEVEASTAPKPPPSATPKVCSSTPDLGKGLHPTRLEHDQTQTPARG